MKDTNYKSTLEKCPKPKLKMALLTRTFYPHLKSAWPIGLCSSCWRGYLRLFSPLSFSFLGPSSRRPLRPLRPLRPSRPLVAITIKSIWHHISLHDTVVTINTYTVLNTFLIIKRTSEAFRDSKIEQ